jgi:hypothetical protein
MRNLRKQSKNAKPDPALGFYNGELRFWLGWAQEVAGDHAAAQESWRQARSELSMSVNDSTPAVSGNGAAISPRPASSTELVSDDFAVLHVATPSQAKSIYDQ